MSHAKIQTNHPNCTGWSMDIPRFWWGITQHRQTNHPANVFFHGSVSGPYLRADTNTEQMAVFRRKKIGCLGAEPLAAAKRLSSALLSLLDSWRFPKMGISPIHRSH